MFRITTNTDEVRAQLSRLARDQIPYATKLGINELAKNIVKREQEEMQRVFDRPTPFIVNGLRVTKWATKQDPSAVVGYKNAFDRQVSNPIENALAPHIPGFGGVRSQKSSEKWLVRAGFMSAGEYLVPSRSCPLDAYGNVRGPTMQKMLQDVGGFRTASGFNHTTRGRKARYVWGAVGRVRGIWLVEGGRDNMRSGTWHLMMLVVRGAKYRPRFDFEGVAVRHAEANLNRFIGAAVAHAIATAR